jgi:hypothetical protein
MGNKAQNVLMIIVSLSWIFYNSEVVFFFRRVAGAVSHDFKSSQGTIGSSATVTETTQNAQNHQSQDQIRIGGQNSRYYRLFR